MLKYKIASIVEAKTEADPGHVYIQIYDDMLPGKILANLCLAYVNDDQFEEELLRKTTKYFESDAANAILADKVRAILTKVEPGLEVARGIIVSEKEKP